ncbi:MAG TPA: SpoIID/LytB domain-containing protein [Myxococcales bacterium]|nr:SpoIID/LytB domain-containing protein [Myxococcales bacterium]
MKTPRRRFLSFLGGALLSRAIRAEDPLFTGVPAPDDPLELLWSRSVSFEEGEPLITVRVAAGRQQIVLRPKGPLSVLSRTASGDTTLAVRDAPQGPWTLQLLEGAPGVGASWVELEQIRYDDKEAVARARQEWAKKGVQVRVTTVGEAYGVAGHVVDTRRYSILAQGDATVEGAQRQAQELESRLGVRVQIRRELSVRPRGRIELRDPHGASAAIGEGALELRAEPGIAVEEVEFGMGYNFHGYEERTYPGRLFACLDAEGALALVAALPMERLVKGVVPSEIFPRAHPEALKAQAVTARGEVLAKIGARHLGDPYLLCAEQHCQVYRGVAAEEPGPGAAVDATRGEALFARTGGESRLVDSVYSAVCGGFTEDNDAVWGGPPDPSLRGRPDFDPRAPGMAQFKDGIGAALVSRFVRLNPVPSYCAQSGFARPDKVRWRRAFTQAEVDEICAPLSVGQVKALAVEGRGVSGRARALHVTGSRASARIYGELAIRRMFRNLNSGMFVVEKAAAGWLFTGGGWGHGSGMCQTGAIGRAERGATYREILDWYYSGAAPVRIY